MKLTLKYKLDSGHFADVWLGSDELGRDVAIKIFRQDDPFSNNAIDHAKALARVDHPNVVRIYGIDTICDPDTGELLDCIAMEFIDGVKLDKLLEGNLEPDVAKRIGVGIIAGLEQIHASGVAHRDLHAGNILVIDGVAKIIDILYLGSLAYFSTETVEQALQRDSRSLRDLLLALLAAANCDPSGMLKLASRSARVDFFELAGEFRGASVVGENPAEPARKETLCFDDVIAAVREQKYDRRLRVREFLDGVAGGIVARAPSQPDDFSELERSFDLNQEPVRQLFGLARVCSAVGDFDALSDSVTFFARLAERYRRQQGEGGRYREHDFVYYRTLGKEIFLTTVSALLMERNPSLIDRFLRLPLEISNAERRRGFESFQYLGRGRLTGGATPIEDHPRWYSPLGEYLKRRHGADGPLHSCPSFGELTAADLLLYFRSFAASSRASEGWWPNTALYAHDVPFFLRYAMTPEGADSLRVMLGIAELELSSDKTLSSILGDSLKVLRSQRGYEHVLEDFDVSSIR